MATLTSIFVLCTQLPDLHTLLRDASAGEAAAGPVLRLQGLGLQCGLQLCAAVPVRGLLQAKLCGRQEAEGNMRRGVAWHNVPIGQDWRSGIISAMQFKCRSLSSLVQIVIRIRRYLAVVTSAAVMSAVGPSGRQIHSLAHMSSTAAGGRRA